MTFIKQTTSADNRVGGFINYEFIIKNTVIFNPLYELNLADNRAGFVNYHPVLQPTQT